MKRASGMDLRTEILKEHSKKQSDKIAAWVCKDKVRFVKLMDLFLHDEYRVVQRSAWIVKKVADEYPEWIQPYLRKMLLYCKKPVHNAVKRNVMNILQEMKLPIRLQGLAVSICFDFLLDTDLPVAVKVFSMTLLHNISIVQPELQLELRIVIQEQMEFAKPAFKSRAAKILKQLAR